MSVWNPDEKKNDEGRVQNAANGNEHFTVHVTLCATNQTRAHGVGHAQYDHAVTDVLDSDRTTDVRLEHTHAHTHTGWPKNGTIFVRLNFIKY